MHEVSIGKPGENNSDAQVREGAEHSCYDGDRSTLSKKSSGNGVLLVALNPTWLDEYAKATKPILKHATAVTKKKSGDP